jgi:hypothetical protein
LLADGDGLAPVDAEPDGLAAGSADCALAEAVGEPGEDGFGEDAALAVGLADDGLGVGVGEDGSGKQMRPRMHPWPASGAAEAPC